MIIRVGKFSNQTYFELIFSFFASSLYCCEYARRLFDLFWMTSRPVPRCKTSSRFATKNNFICYKNFPRIFRTHDFLNVLKLRRNIFYSRVVPRVHDTFFRLLNIGVELTFSGIIAINLKSFIQNLILKILIPFMKWYGRETLSIRLPYWTKNSDWRSWRYEKANFLEKFLSARHR